MNSFLFSHFHEHILQPFPDALQSSCSEKFRNISNEKGTPTEVFSVNIAIFSTTAFL